MNIDQHQQQVFFNDSSHQYRQKDLLTPPSHTAYEIGRFMSLVKVNISGKNIIDFGSGTGRISIPLLKEKFNVCAVDISKESLQNLYQIAKKMGLHAQLETKTALQGTKAHAVIGTDILHHVDLKKHILLFPHHLHKKGMILFSEPNAYNIAWFFYFPLYAFIKKIPVKEYIQIEKGFLQCRYGYIKKSLQDAGFKTIRIYGHGLLPPPILWKSSLLSKFNYFLGDLPLLRFFAYRFFIYAKK